MLAALGPLAYALVATRADNPRALARRRARRRRRPASRAGGSPSPIPTAALAEARRRAAGGLVVVCGSIFLRSVRCGRAARPERRDPVEAAQS